MQRSFSYILLITWFFLFPNCNPQYVITTTEKKNLTVSELTAQPDSQLIAIYTPYKNLLEKDMNRVIAIAEEEMVKGKPESNLTNFLADLLLEEGKEIAAGLQPNFHPDISFFNYGGIRTFLPEGKITVGKIYELMPFENELVFIQLSGAQVREFFNWVAEKGGDSLGGVRFKIAANKAAEIEIGNLPLNDDADYWLVTNDYIAGGGDGLEIFTRRKNFVAGRVKIRDVIVTHLEKIHQKEQLVSAKTDGRISYE